jgi:geranylgeranyl pyrophosphate synthase
LGTDFACGKLTLPILILLEQGTDSEQARVRSLVENWAPKNFPEIFELLNRHNALTQSQTIIYQQIERAQEAVTRVSQSENSQALVALGDYLAQQTDALGVSTGSHGHYDANSRP